MEVKEKKVSWLAKLLFGKWCLMPGYSHHLDFFEETARRSQRREDEFVEREIERIAQDQFDNYVLEQHKWAAFLTTLKHPERASIFPGFHIYQRSYPNCYHVYDSATAKYKDGGIDEKIQERYKELMKSSGSQEESLTPLPQ